MNLAQARKQLPELAGLDDQSAFELIHQAYYPTWDKTYLAQQLDYTPPVAEPKPAGLLRTVGDVGIKLAQGAVDLGSSVVGLGSLATGGLVGQGMRAIGYDPHATNAALGEYLSDSQKAAEAKVRQADGFGATLAAAIDNPRSILGSVAESAPGMLAGMGVTSAVARGIAAKAALATAEGAAASAAELAAGKTAIDATRAALATQAGKSAATNAVEAAGKRLLAIGAATEGAQGAGQIADDAQAAGRAYSDYALPALAAGTLTGSIGYGAGRLLGDSATQLATGAQSTGVKGGLMARIGKEAFSEGVLEEMPQSAQEQYFANIAQGEANRMNGVGNAAATGLLVGGAMGAGMGGMQNRHGHPLPESGPLTQAANAAAAAAASGTLPGNTIAYETTPVPKPAPASGAADLSLVSYPEGGIDFDPQPDMRGAHQRTPITPVSELGQHSAAVPTYADGIEYMPPSQEVSDSNILNFSERNAPLHLRHAQALVATGKGRKLDLQVVPHAGGDGYIVVPTLWLSAKDRQQYAPLQQRGVLPAPSGSFANMSELADLAQAERLDIVQQRANLLAQQQEQAKARQAEADAQLAALAASEAAQAQQRTEAEQEAAIPVTNAIIAHDMAQRAQSHRAALRNEVLNNTAIPPRAKKAAFRAALKRDGYANPHLNEEDHREIDLATVPVRTAPNELVDIVPQRKPALPQRGERDGKHPNVAAVDAAIAAGMRLRTKNGSVLHKQGSSKIFRLNQAQKAYYLKQLAKQNTLHDGVNGLEDNAAAARPETVPQASADAQLNAAAPASIESDLPTITPQAEPEAAIEAAAAIEPEAVIEPATAIEPAPTVAEAHQAEPATSEISGVDDATERKALNRLTVKDMNNEQLIRAKQLFANTPRAPKINKELAARGLTGQAAPAGAQSNQEQPAPVKNKKGRKTPAPTALQNPAENEVVHLLEIGKWIDAFHLARRIGKPFGFVVNMIQDDLPAIYVDTRPMEIAAGLPGFVGRALSKPGDYYSGPWHVVDTRKGKYLSAEGKTMEEVVEKVKNGFANATPEEIAEFGAHLPDVSQASLQAAWLEGIEQLIARSENKAPATLHESAPTAHDANAAEATANPAPTHSEGNTIEAATPAVIAQSIAKSAANTPMNLKQAKADLLAQIDAAMAHVADERVVQAQKAELQAADELYDKLLKSKETDKIQLGVAERRLRAARRAFQMVTFDVPGDGKFTVRNTKENLLAFRARVSSNPGFSGRSTALKIPIPAGLHNSAETSIADMLADNEWVAAFNLAQRIGKPFRFGANGKTGAPILYVDTRDVDVGHGLSTFAGRQVPVLSKAGAYRSGRWYVMEATKGLSIGEGGDTLAEAITAAKNKLAGVTPEKLAQAMANMPDALQSTLEAAWLTYAEEQDALVARLRHNLPLKPTPAQSERGTSEDAMPSAPPESAGKHAAASSAATPTPTHEPVAMPAPAQEPVAAADPVAAHNSESESSAPPAETAPQPNNKRHTVKKSKVLTPAGAIKASATGQADTQIWYHQGNVSQLEFNAKVTVNGQPPSESAKRRWAEIQHARARGWRLANYRAGSLGTVWVLEKKDEFLTRAGAQTDGADLFARPDTPEPETGWASIQARHWAYSAALAKWLATLPESTLNSLPALSAKFNATGIATWARIMDDNSGKLIRFFDAAGNMDCQYFARNVTDFARRQGMNVPPDLDTLLHLIAAQVETGRKGSATHDEHNQIVVARLRAGESGPEAIKRVISTPAENAMTDDAPVADVAQDVPQPAGEQVMESTTEAPQAEPAMASATDEPQAETAAASATGESEEDEANKVQDGSDAPSEVAHATGTATDDPASAPVTGESSTGPATDAPTGDTNQAAQAVMPLASLAAFEQLFNRASHGQLSVDEFHAAFASFNQNEAAILAELSLMKKDDLLRYGGAAFTYQHRADRKETVMHELIDTLREQFAFAKDSTLSYSLTSNHATWPAARRNSVNEAVASTTQDDLERYAAKAQEQRDQRKAKLAGLSNPQTLDDYIALMRAKMREGSSFKDARLSLSLEQRAMFDQLSAEKSWAERGANKAGVQALQAPNAPVGSTDIIQTKHTKHGHDLWQFNLDQRVSSDQFKALVVQARRLGGDYSSYRGHGAIPGWQFRSEDAAKAFKQLIAGETGAAEQVMQARRDAFADDKSQSAVERLREMADAMETQANDSLSRERKTNTSRRAQMADRADSTARAAVAFAATMRNIAQAIESGTTHFLVHVRQKTQIALLTSIISRAWYDQRVASGLSYGEIEQQKGMPADQETADHAEWPAYSAYRSDLAKLGRQLLEVDGTKQLGRDILKVADDVTDEYLAFAKKNLGAVMRFHAKDGGLLGFPSKTAVEDAIARSGYRGRAIPYAIKRNQWTVIYSPTEAISQGAWQGDGDKRIHLNDEFGRNLVDKIGRVNNRGAQVSVPWQFETAHQRQATLARMNIQTPAELRAALREFIALQQSPPEPDKIKMLERQMVGRTHDGLDFFPTGPAAVDEMIDVAEIEPGMAVLEPSAGWGHIAEKIRDAGVEPDVVELSGDRRELLEMKGFSVIGHDFLELHPDSKRYDRILMNPPFSNRRDADHVQHAYTLLAPGGRLVAIMGEGVFFGQDKKAQAFRGWLDAVGGTSEKLPEGSFMDASLPVNTSVNARMVVINAPSAAIGNEQAQGRTDAQVVEATDTTVPIDEARLIDVGLLREERNGKWQYKPWIGGTWLTSNDKESAVQYATVAYHETPADQRLPQEQRGELADAQEHALSERRYGLLTMDQLRARYAQMTAEIDQLQAAGRREFDGNGGRRTAAAVSNEAAREVGAEKMRLARFIAFREAQALVPKRPLSAEQEADLKEKVKRLADIEAKMNRAVANAVGDGTYRHKSRARATTSHARASSNAQFRDTVATHLRLTVRELLASGYHVPDKYVDPIRVVLDYNAEGNFEPITDSIKPKLSQSAPTVAGHSAPSLAAAMASALRRYGDDFFANLLATGKVRVIDSKQASILLTGHAQDVTENPLAFFNPADGITYLIADAISQQTDEKALHGLMLHELANHALQMGRSTPEFAQLLNYFSLMQNGNKAVAAAFARARQVGTDPARLNEEALGYYLEANPTLSFAKKVVAWFRAVIRSLGMALTPLMHRARWFRSVALMSPEDLTYAAQKVLKNAPQALAQQSQSAMPVATAAQVTFSKAQQESLLVSTWSKIAGAKDVYQYPVSNSRDLATVLQTVMPDIKIEPLPLDDAKARSKASRQWRVTLPDGKQAFIFEFGRDLQIDASRLVSGSSRGSSLYAAVANYAYNTGKVLEGDSAGFSEVAQMRRLENMISTALKFGTTDHIRPHPLQRNPRGPLAQRLGMKGFSWATGDFEHNVAQMMRASYDYIYSLVPEIADVHVTEFSDFIGNDGDLFTDDSFRQLEERATGILHQRMAASGINTTAQIGSATLKRAAITGTILRREGSKAGRALLGLIGTELHANIGQAENILYSRGLGQALSDAANQISQVQLPAGYVVGDLFNQSGKLSWWHKTIGTMDNLAKRHPAFAQVYETVQSFLGDVSRYAVVAADKAPTLLPKLENISDILGAKRKKPLTAQDSKAISAPIFEGTLIWARDENGLPVKLEAMEARAKLMSVEEKAMILQQQNVIDVAQNRVWQRQKPESYAQLINSKYEESQLTAGVVWQDQELRDLFGLSDAQIGLYREFRAAIDMSLTNLTISEMVKLGGKDAKPLLDMAMTAGDLRHAADLLTRHFMDLAQMHLDQQDSHLDTAQQIANLAGRGLDLMERGYAPLTRFGRYTVYVQENGEQLYFGLFESQIEAGKMARRMRSQFPDADVLHGTLSDESYKLFAGISPETVELFGSMVGLDSQADAASTQVYQTYLKLAKSNRSALKRLIERKGIAGFSEDAGRVLAGFIYSNARLTSGNTHLGEIDEAVAAIPKQQGQLVDAAMQLREHIRNPEGNSTMLGGLMFAQFLGGSVASAMVNLTQPLTMTLPYLSQFGGIAKAGQRLMTAVRDAGKAQTGDAKLDAGLKWAADEGIVAPQEVHYLQAQAAGKGVLQSGDGTKIGDARATWNNVRAKLMLGWGKLFAMAELTNRRVTFIAAWRTAVEQGMANPAHFAREAVAQTQGVYNSGNKPRWARSTLGGLALTFKQYSIAYVELLSRMAFAGKPGSPERAAGQRAALYMVAVLFLMAGADGLPFEKNLEDAIDGILQRLGYNFSSKRQKQAFLTDVLGEGGADFVLKGVSSLPGMPIDVAGRFGMGNLIPATGLLTKKESYTSDLGELAGPAGDVAKRAFHATGKALGGDLVDAALEVSPLAVRNLAKGIDMLATGEYKDTRGYKVNDVTPVEATMKMIGFQPESTAKIQDAKGQALNMLAQARMRSSEIQEHLAQGIVSGDVEMQREARGWRNDWNAKNPETPVMVNMPGIIRRVRAMRQDVILRTQLTAPKALKQSVRKELQQEENLSS